MPLLQPPLSIRLSKFLNRVFSLCWLVPLAVADDEQLLRAIYSPYHINKNNKLRREAYTPSPKTDEISSMRLQYMGAPLCRKKARFFEMPEKKKYYRGFAMLKVSTVRSQGMQVLDSRRHFCGHADIRYMIEELVGRESSEPLSPELGKRLKDLQNFLLSASTYISDPEPRTESQPSSFVSSIERRDAD